MENKKIDHIFYGDGLSTLDSSENPIKSSCELLMIAVDLGQYSPKENVEATKLYRVLDEQKENPKLTMTPAQFEQLKKAFNNLKSGRSEEISNLYEYLESI